MPWMLQPKNSMQVLQPNWYNVAYRRTGTYKGMGQLTRPGSSWIGYGLGQIGPCDPTDVNCMLANLPMVNPTFPTTVSPLQLSAALTPGASAPSLVPTTSSTGLSTGTVLLIAGGVVIFLLVMMAAKR
jgi:hypothetical protein